MRSVQSMTGFGRASTQVGGESFRIELRSVNGRHLDVRINAPVADAELEVRLLRLVRARIERGRVDLTVAQENGTLATARVNLDAAVAAHAALEAIRARLGLAAPVSLDLVAAQRGVLGTGPLAASEPFYAALEQGTRDAIDALLRARAEEGAALLAELSRHLAALRAGAGRLRALAAAAPEAARRRLQARLDDLLGAEPRLEPARLAAEVALLATRSDIQEELTRADSHFDRVEALLGGPGPVGRKLDFLCQEIGREVNTMGAKLDDLAGIGEVLGMKAELERMREQAQNLE
jgi:uncharacterized protein (TIGR00255 family)